MILRPHVMLFALVAAASFASTPEPDPFQAYLDAPQPPADGFDLPLRGRCSGKGPVQAIGAGQVVEAGDLVTIEHLFYENHEKRQVRSTYQGLSQVDVKVGDRVARGQVIGTASRLRLQLSEAGDACAFIRQRRALPVPHAEPTLVLVHQGSYRMRVYSRGALDAEYEIGLGQGVGPKEERGDLKTPVGMYFVVDKSTGPFAGDYAEFYGGHWIKLNYPNPYDGDRGVARSLITPAQRQRLSVHWARRELTEQGTKLGGGIGFHGWASEWNREELGSHLSWGCVVLHNRDLPGFFERVPLGAMVVIF